MAAWSALPVMRFPIPMRGNERDVNTLFSAGAGAFPIPMRGNEMRITRHRRVDTVVPDPHEG